MVAGANAAVAMATCQPLEAADTIDNGAGEIPWVKTPIYFVGRDEIGAFVCSHGFWLDIDEVYANAPDQKPSC